MKRWQQALRALARRPQFAIAVVLILASGIAANTAVFSIVDAVLLKPLPYPDPDRLVTVMEASSAARNQESLIAPPRLEDWNRMNRTFDAIVHDVEPTRAVFGAQPLQNAIDASWEQTRLNTELVTVFGAAALGLASIGLYGLVTLIVTSHRREIGIRMALGAAPGRIVNEVASGVARLDRKSTRLNSSHLVISYAVFCLKKKKRYLDGDGSAHAPTGRAHVADRVQSR